MNRSELVETVAKSAGLDKRHADAAVTAMIEAVVKEAKSGARTSIFGFGTFMPTSRSARVGRNPQTGAPVKIAASKSVRFSPASAFKSALNSKGAAKKAPPAKKAASSKKAAVKKAAVKKATKSTKKK